jgi:hypothetical protein
MNMGRTLRRLNIPQLLYLLDVVCACLVLDELSSTSLLPTDVLHCNEDFNDRTLWLVVEELVAHSSSINQIKSIDDNEARTVYLMKAMMGLEKSLKTSSGSPYGFLCRILMMNRAFG